MKRLFLLLLAVLLLAGCGADTPENTEAAVTATEEATLPGVGLYEPDSAMEQATDGAVRAYPLDAANCTGMELMGQEVLLFFEEEKGTVLTLFSEEDLKERVRLNLSSSIFPAEPDVRVGTQGVGYYDSLANAVIFLDAQLQESGRMLVPDVVQGTPVLTQDWSTIYYCTDTAIRGLNLQTGNPRLIRGDYTCQWQTLNQLFWNDTILKCTIGASETEVDSFYFAVEDGEMLFTGEKLQNLSAAGDWYYASVLDGTWKEHIFGQESNGPYTLELEENVTIYPALELGGLMTAAADETGMELSYYDLETGKRIAQVQLPGVTAMTDYAVDVGSKRVWLLSWNAESGDQTLFRWDYQKSKLDDSKDYSQPYYTAENPDTQGLAECRSLAENLNQKYGVVVTLGEEVVPLAPEHYTYVPEYRVKVIKQGLENLESALSAYPEGFLQEAASRTESGVIHIALARAITGAPEKGTPAEVQGVQYWSSDVDAYIGLTLNETLQKNLHMELFHVLDNYVLTSCVVYDDWEKLNPRGFEYDYDYVQNLERQDTQYLEAGSQFFVDLYSMSFPVEDRASIMACAMTEGTESYFESQTMQKKLTVLCEGIRTAFELEESTEIFPWEVYLETPLAPEADE